MVQTTDNILRKLGHFEHDLCDEQLTPPDDRPEDRPIIHTIEGGPGPPRTRLVLLHDA